MNGQTPAAFGNEGLEKLAGDLESQDKSRPSSAQDNCGDCRAFDQFSSNFPGFGYCKRRAPSVDGDEFWPRVRPDNWCLDYVPRNGGRAK